MERKQAHNIDWDLLAKDMAGELAPEEHDRLVQELSGEKDLLGQLRTLWGDAKYAQEIKSIDSDKAWSKVRKEIGKPQKARIAQLGSTLKKGMMVAATLIVVMMTYLLVKTILPIDSYEQVVAQTEVTQINLNDGTIVDLNIGSELYYSKDFNEEARVVKLTGEAFFDVARDESKPFVIQTGALNIKVLGTSFNVRMDQATGDGIVTVSSGLVEVWHNNDHLILEKDEAADFNAATNSLVKVNVPDINYKAWKTREIEFDNVSLKEAFAIIELAYHVRIDVNKEVNMDSLIVNANFSHDDLEHVLRTVCQTFNLSYSGQNNNYQIKPAR